MENILSFLLLRITIWTVCLISCVELTFAFGFREFGEPCDLMITAYSLDDRRTNPGVIRTFGSGNSIVHSYTENPKVEQSESQQYNQKQSNSYQDQQQSNQNQQQSNQNQQRSYQNQQQSNQNQQQSYQNQQQSYQNQYNQHYQQYSRDMNETHRCKSEKGLRCDRYTRKCKCFDLAGAVWSYDREICEFPLGTFCSASVAEYSQHCVEYAECTCNWQHWDRRRWYPCDNPPVMDERHRHPYGHMDQHDTTNGKCFCQPGYKPHDDNSGCFYTTASFMKCSSWVIFLTFSLVKVISMT